MFQMRLNVAIKVLARYLFRQYIVETDLLLISFVGSHGKALNLKC